MKRVISLALVIFCIVGLAACGKDTPANVDTSFTSVATDPVVTKQPSTPTGNEPEDGSDTVQVDESLLTVELTIPASYFGMDAESLEVEDDYAAEQGFISAEVKDGNMVIVMTKARQKEILDSYADGIDTMIGGYIGGEETPYIQGITYTENFTEFTMKVDREGYEKVEYDSTSISLSLSAAIYQMYAGIPADVTINVFDAATDELIWSSEG